MATGQKEQKLDLESLKSQTNLTAEQEELIAQEALKEFDDEQKSDSEKEEVKPEKEENDDSDETEEMSDEELLAADDKDLDDTLKAHKKELIEEREQQKQQEEQRLIDAKEEDLKDEEKVKRQELIKSREEQQQKQQKEELESYAKEQNISIEDAQKDFESIAKIQEKYKGDAKQLARANLHLQRLASKSSEELKVLKQTKASVPKAEITIENIIKHLDDGKFKDQKTGTVWDRESVIAAYKNQNPTDTENMSDEQVLKFAAKEMKSKIEQHQTEARLQLREQAQEKRAKLFDEVKDSDKEFVATAKEIVDNLSDEQILNDKFSIDTYIVFAKGQKYDDLKAGFEAEKKQIAEKEFKRGQEEAKIIGVKKTPQGKPPKKTNIALTEIQKKRALEMFDIADISQERKFELYIEHLKETGEKL